MWWLLLLFVAAVVLGAVLGKRARVWHRYYTFYVAGKYANKAELLTKVRQLEQHGWRCTYKWMLQPEHGVDEMAEYAQQDLQGVREAEVFIAVLDDPTYAYRGTFVELGAALALRKTIVVYKPCKKAECYANCFLQHPLVFHYEDWDELVEHVYFSTPLLC